MNNTSKIALLLIAIMLLGVPFFGSNVQEPVSGQGNVDQGIQSGDTYWYNVSKFPSFDRLMNLTGSSSISENTTIDVTGGFAGSDIYVKVLDINNQTQTYYDGSQTITEEVPVLDIAVGLITGQQIKVNTTINGSSTIETLPEGMAFPITSLLGGTTNLAFLNDVFNVSAPTPKTFLPVPVALNDGYSTHQAVIQSADSIIDNGSLSVTNDASQFRMDATDLLIEDSPETYVNGFMSWRKSDGLMTEINFDFESDTETLFAIDIDFQSVEANGVDVKVGDQFNMSVVDAGFDYSVFGNDSTERAHELAMIDGNLTNSVGHNLLELTVQQVDGMYYQVEGTYFNGTHDVSVPGEGQPDIWLHGFGRKGPGVPMPSQDPTNDTKAVEFYNGTTDTYETVYLPSHVRERALPGPFISEDYQIYEAWDQTMAFIAEAASTSLIDLFESLENSFATLSYNSSISDKPVIDLTWSGSGTTSGYETTLNSYFDINVLSNNSHYEEYYNSSTGTYEKNTSAYTEAWKYIETEGTFNFSSSYDDSNRFDSFRIDGEVSTVENSVYKENFTEVSNTTHTELNISNWRYEINSSYNRTSTGGETTTTTTTSDTTDTTKTTSSGVDSTTDTSNSTTSDTTGETTTNDTADIAPEVPGYTIVSSVISLTGMVVTLVLIKRRR